MVKSSKGSNNNDLQNQLEILCRLLGQIIEKHPELGQIIEVWETLPEDAKQQIWQIVQGG